MKRREFFKGAVGSGFVLGATHALTNFRVLDQGKDFEYRVVGTFVDGCACSVPCPCIFSGSFKEGCNNIGMLVLTSGEYKGVDLAGARMVEAGLAGNWIRVYIDTSDLQREAATALATTAFSVYGKIEAVKSASIGLSGKEGKYQLTVDGGKTLEMMTEPVFGVDQRTPIVLTNVPTAFGSAVMQ